MAGEFLVMVDPYLWKRSKNDDDRKRREEGCLR